MQKFVRMLGLFSLIVFSCLLSASCSEQENTVTTSVIGKKELLDGTVTEICVNNYTYVVITGAFGMGISQKWENTTHGPRPKMCSSQKSIIPGKE